MTGGDAELYQLAYTAQVYGDHARWWLVVSDDLEKELTGPSSKRQSRPRGICTTAVGLLMLSALAA